MIKRLGRGVAVAAVALIAVSACSDDRLSPPFVVVGAPAGAAVSAIDNEFRLGAPSVPAGTEIVFTNDGRNDHNIVASDGATDWGVTRSNFAPGAEYRHTFTEPGTYQFFCSLHGTSAKGMVGSLTVTPVAGEDQAPAPVAEPAATTEPVPATTAAAEPAPAADDGVLDVPADFPTIQEAVNAAAPGDLVLIAPGTYREAVNVTTNELTIRGADRNTVILDGEFKLDNGIRVLDANGVAVENMTAMNYTANGFFWTGVEGYRGSYLTAYRTGDYGVYAFDSVKGQLDHIYAAGSPDAGIYIGGCYPCDAVVDKVVSEHNGLGYSGTNSGGGLWIVNSVFRYNRAGIVPNSGSYEPCYPERETTIVGNLVYSNNQGDTPAIDVALLAMGNGIVSAGGVRNTIARNQVYDHDKAGVALVPFLEEDPNDAALPEADWGLSCAETRVRPLQKPDGAVLWDAMQNTVVDNEISDSRQFDIIVASAGGDLSTFGNCFSGNKLSTVAPTQLLDLATCDSPTVGDWSDGAYDIVAWLAEQHPPSVDWKIAKLPALAQQENMPDAATAPARPATDVPYQVDEASIKLPARADG